MRKKQENKAATTAPWFLSGGQLVGVRQDLLEVLRAMDGKSPREIFAERKEATDQETTVEASTGYATCFVEGLHSSGVVATGNVAIVHAIGVITQYAGICDWMFGGTSLERFMGDMEAALVDETVSAIVAVFDSPGGEASGIADAADRIRAMSAVKPIVACVTGDGCSAAYWLASAANEIVASQTAILGSIGIVMTYVDDTEAEKQAGIRRIEFVSSVAPNKRADPASDAGKVAMQSLVDEYGDIFVGAVAAFRGVTAEKVKADFGQGGVLIGASAVNAGLADRIGTLDDAIQAAFELAGAASDSTTGGTPRPTTGAIAGKEGQMAKLTAEQILAEHPEAAAEIAAASAEAERTRISGIMKYNTAAHRAVAGDKIDAAIKDGKTTAGDLAVQILDAQEGRLKKTAADREADSKEEGDFEVAPPDAESPAQAKAKIDTAAVYARLNGTTPKEGK